MRQSFKTCRDGAGSHRQFRILALHGLGATDHRIGWDWAGFEMGIVQVFDQHAGELFNFRQQLSLLNYQKPGGWFEVGANDLSLRKCLETKVDIFKA